MKIALVIHCLSSGGAERVMSDMANYWAARGADVTLITIAGSEIDDFYRLDPSVKRIRLGEAGASANVGARLLANAWRITALRRAIIAVKPDVVLSFLVSTNVVSILATRGLGIRTVVSERNDPVAQSLGRIWRTARMLMYRFADLVVAQTQTAGDWLRFRCAANVRVVPNPLRPLPAVRYVREPLIVSVGRLTRQKGFDLLLEAFARIRGDFPDWRLIILGEGEERSSLEAMAARLDISAHLSLPGRCPDVEEWFCRAGLVVQPSRWEGFPNVVLEAMASGAAVISCDCPSGPAELIRDRVNGHLVPVEDVAGLSVAMTELMASQMLREQLGENAREVRSRYGQERIMAAWEEALLGDVAGSFHRADPSKS